MNSLAFVVNVASVELKSLTWRQDEAPVLENVLARAWAYPFGFANFQIKKTTRTMRITTPISFIRSCANGVYKSLIQVS